jgi:hypothetical protein
MRHSLGTALHRPRAESLKSTSTYSESMYLTLMLEDVGNRSSTDEAREPADQDETIVDEQQNNGMSRDTVYCHCFLLQY